MASKKEQDWSTTIVTYSTVIFAVVSLITAYITITSWRAQRQADRPYFSLKESPVVERSEGLWLEFKFTNVGKHPASNLVSNTFVFDQSLQQKPVHVDEYALINDIPRETMASLIIKLDPQELSSFEDGVGPQYVVIYLAYSDPVINQSYYQSLYLKWAGIEGDRPQPLIHAQAQEKEKILSYLKRYRLKIE